MTAPKGRGRERPAGPRGTPSARTGCQPSVHEICVQNRGEVALAERRHNHHDQLSFVLRASRDLDCRVDRGAGGDADQEALALGRVAGHRHGGLGVHVDDLVIDGPVEDLGDEIGPDALDLVRTGRSAVQDRRFGRLHSDDLHARLALFQYLADAGDRPAGADAGDQDVDSAVGVVPDFHGGRAAVNLGVGLVGELPGEYRAGTLLCDVRRLVHGALHTQWTRRQDQFGTVGTEQGSSLLGHGFGHGQDHVVATGGTDERERDPGVAARRLDDGPARWQLAGTFRCVDDGDPDPVLDRTGRVVELQLGHDGCIQSLRQLVQPDERGVADQLRDVVVDLCHESSWAWPGVAREVRDKNTPRSTYFDGPELTAVGWVTGGDGATREILSVGHAQHVTNEGNS